MRRWYVPLTVLGLGSLGAFLLSEPGKNMVRTVKRKFRNAPEALWDWNESVMTELDHIQAVLDHIADTLGPRPEPGH